MTQEDYEQLREDLITTINQSENFSLVIITR